MNLYKTSYLKINRGGAITKISLIEYIGTLTILENYHNQLEKRLLNND